MHCWNVEAVAEKSNAKKNSATKKTDDLESYVQRDEKGNIVIPTSNFCASIREAGKAFSDPTSPRASMRERLKAIIFPFEEYGVFKSVHEKTNKEKTWDFVDARRVVIQRAGITRRRPGYDVGWNIEFKITVMEPEFLDKEKLIEIIENAGKFKAIGDFRPTYGRFRISSFDVITD